MTTEQTSEVDEIIYKAFKQCFLLNNLSLMYQMSEIPELIIKNILGNIPGGPVAKTSPSMQEMWVQSLVGKLRSYMPHDRKN